MTKTSTAMTRCRRQWMLATLLLCLLPLQLWAEMSYQEGVHYQRLETAAIPRDPGKIEVIEIFWYGCSHCYRLEPALQNWVANLSRDVDFWRSPGIWNGRMELHAQAFYTAEALNMIDKLHKPIFDALNQQNQPLGSKEEIRTLFTRYGVKADEFDQLFDSFGVQSKVKQASSRFRDFRLTGVPAFVVNGKYKVTGEKLKSEDEMLKVVGYLIGLERKARAAPAAAH